MELSSSVAASIKNKGYIVDPHFIKRIRQRDLKKILDDNVLEKVILEGQVIEKLERYSNGEKYVVYCEYGEKKFHVVLRYNNGTLLLKTIYLPNSLYYERDLKTKINGDLLYESKKK